MSINNEEVRRVATRLTKDAYNPSNRDQDIEDVHSPEDVAVTYNTLASGTLSFKGSVSGDFAPPLTSSTVAISDYSDQSSNKLNIEKKKEKHEDTDEEDPSLTTPPILGGIL